MALFRVVRLCIMAAGCVVVLSPAGARGQESDILDNLGGAQKPPDKAAPASSPAEGSAPGAAQAVAPPDRSQAAPVAGEPANAASEKQGAVTSEAAAAALDRIKAVPRKSLLKRHRFELSPLVSLSLNDAYYQHYAAGGSIIFYPHDAFGIGLGAEYLFAHLETRNIQAVRQNLISVPSAFEKPSLFAHIDAYFVPLYGKLSLFSSGIIQFDTYLVGGGGVAVAGSHRWPGVNVGLGQRFVLSHWLALRFEVRDELFIGTFDVNGLARSDTQNYVLFLAGASVFFPTSFEYTF